MAKSDQFKNKLKDLQNTEFEHPEDFFTRAEAMDQQAQQMYQQATAQGNTQGNSQGQISYRRNGAEEVWIDTSNEGYEGQLAVDVYQDNHFVYVQAIIGGISPEDIEVHLNNDMLTIKGKRSNPRPVEEHDAYYIQECYWGGFSRSIILPVDIQNDKVEANTENGVLTISLPKSKRPKNSRIPVQPKQ